MVQTMYLVHCTRPRMVQMAVMGHTLISRTRPLNWGQKTHQHSTATDKFSERALNLHWLKNYPHKLEPSTKILKYMHKDLKHVSA